MCLLLHRSSLLMPMHAWFVLKKDGIVFCVLGYGDDMLRASKNLDFL
jgi:hypothetical protein